MGRETSFGDRRRRGASQSAGMGFHGRPRSIFDLVRDGVEVRVGLERVELEGQSDVLRVDVAVSNKATHVVAVGPEAVSVVKPGKKPKALRRLDPRDLAYNARHAPLSRYGDFEDGVEQLRRMHWQAERIEGEGLRSLQLTTDQGTSGSVWFANGSKELWVVVEVDGRRWIFPLVLQ